MKGIRSSGIADRQPKAGNRKTVAQGKGGMGVEKRGNNSYFYLKQRIGKRVVSRYIGKDSVAGLAAQHEALKRAQRQMERNEEHEERIRVKESDEQFEELEQLISDLLTVTLIANGYHERKGQWRKPQGNHQKEG